jgi:hypothetical protein
MKPENILLGLIAAWVAWFAMHYFSVAGGYIVAKILGINSARAEYNSYFGLFQKPNCLYVDDSEIKEKRGRTIVAVLCGLLTGAVPMITMFLWPYIVWKDANSYAASLCAVLLVVLYIFMALPSHLILVSKMMKGEMITKTGDVPEQQA